MQAIANTAGFHFAFIEQGGSSLYSIMALKATSLEVLRIIVSIGGVETNHFSLWHDKAGNAVAQPLAGVTDPETGTTFPDLNAKGGELNQTNLILPEPCEFLHKDLPDCSIVRPTLDRNGGAVAAIESLTADRLFEGQSPKFFRTVRQAGARGRRRRASGPLAHTGAPSSAPSAPGTGRGPSLSLPRPVHPYPRRPQCSPASSNPPT